MKATVDIETSRIIGRVDPKIYGQFLSRRRGVADGGLYDPQHPDADERGLRRQVVEAIAESAPTVVRWPGGCTGTSYDWKEGIGPRTGRARTIDAHFGYDVSNGFGTTEFVELCRRIGAEPHLNLNIGTATLREALEWIEYTNLTTPSKWANLRREHGYEEPLDVRYWQIGNEEWGAWEIGQRSAADYALTAREWAKAVKKLDPSLRVLASGSWHASQMLEWNQTVLNETWPHIDYLTAHYYWPFDSERGIDNYDAIAGVGYLEEQKIRAAAGLIELVARRMRSTHRPRLAFTEWNCRDVSHGEMSSEWKPGRTQYRLVDALACAGFLNALQRQCEHVGLATLAQSINVVGMLVATPTQVIRETVYWPLAMQRHHSGGMAVSCHVDCAGYDAEFEGREVEGIPYLDVSTTLDEKSRKLYVSVVNRHRDEEVVARLRMHDATPASTARIHRLWHENPLARNTSDAPEAIVPTNADIDIPGAEFEVSLPPHSYSVLDLRLNG